MNEPSHALATVRYGLIVFVAVAAIVDISCVVAVILVAGPADSPSRINALPSADAAVVFYTPDEPGITLRLQAARVILDQGKARDVVCVGGARPWRRYYGCSEITKGLVASGVDRAHVVADVTSSDSLSNIEALDQIAVQQGYKSVILISDPMHLLRLNADIDHMKTPLRIGRYASGVGDFLNLLRRGQWEVAAWVSRALPRSLALILIKLTRQ